MGTILDVILCVILLCFIVSGFKIGLVRSLVELIGYIFAIIASVVFADFLTDWVGVYLTKLRPTTVVGHVMIKIICMIVIFVVLQFLIRLLSHALDTVFRLPILHQVNSLLGGVFGLAKGVLVLFLICAVLRVMLPIITMKFPDVNEKEMTQSHIYQYLYINNPVYLLYQSKFRME